MEPIKSTTTKLRCSLRGCLHSQNITCNNAVKEIEDANYIVSISGTKSHKDWWFAVVNAHKSVDRRDLKG